VLVVLRRLSPENRVGSCCCKERRAIAVADLRGDRRKGQLLTESEGGGAWGQGVSFLGATGGRT